MKYGYARVSTSDQKLENQISILEEAGTEKIYQEKFTEQQLNVQSLKN